MPGADLNHGVMESKEEEVGASRRLVRCIGWRDSDERAARPYLKTNATRNCATSEKK